MGQKHCSDIAAGGLQLAQKCSLHITNQLTPRNIVLEKLIVTHLVKILHTFYGAGRFITMFTKSYH
jgi:hypothetical protein